MFRKALAVGLVALAGSLGSCQTGKSPGDSGYKIAVIPKGLTHDFWLSIHAGALKAADEFKAQGIQVSIDWQGPDKESDREQQIKIVQTEPSDFEPALPDLAICVDDLEYKEDWGLLMITVHNIGAADIGEYDVMITETESGKTMSAIGSTLAAPLDFTPKRTRFGFQFAPTKERHSFVVEVKSRKGERELTLVNNSLPIEASLLMRRCRYAWRPYFNACSTQAFSSIP